MLPRAEKRTDVREGWPFVVAQFPDGRRFTFRMHGGPVQRGDLRDYLVDAQRRTADALAAAAARAADAAKADPPLTPEEADALVDASREAVRQHHETAQSVAGWLLLWAWYDVDRDLQAAIDYDAGAFKGEHARLLAGTAAADELMAAGWAWEDVDDAARQLFGLLTKGRPPGQAVVDLVPFSLTLASTTS